MGRSHPAVQVVRLSRVGLHLVRGLAITGLLFPFYGLPRRRRTVQRWFEQLLDILSVKLQVRGEPPLPGEPTLIVANHVSWLDICILNAACQVRFVAKSEIRGWPLVGWLSYSAGTLFVQRGHRRDAARIGGAVVEAIARGEHVAVFPEGTTSDGTELLRFHASPFEPAVGARAQVIAAALRFPGRDGGVNLDASYAGERSLIESLRLIVAQREIRAELMFCSRLDAAGKSRRDLARDAERIIAQALGLPPPRREPERFSGLPA